MSQLYNIRYILWVILYRILLYMLYIIYLLIHDINTWYWILIYHYIMHAKPLQSCPTLCHPMNYSLPGSFVCGISQARLLEWVTISFSKGSSWSRDQTWVFCLAGVTGNTGLIPVSGRSPWRRNGNPLQYSCLENPMDRGS